MPEYPDITVYIDRLKSLLISKPIQSIRLINPFFLRTFDPPLSSAAGLEILNLTRMGKRIVFELQGNFFIVLHLMIAGRLHWKDKGYKANRRIDLAVIDFEHGALQISEVAKKKRASLHIFSNRDDMEKINPGGLEVLEASFKDFKQAITAENHTLKRTMTDPRILSGIGNAYSDEILHHAKLSPILQTQKMNDEQIKALLNSICTMLNQWTEKLMAEVTDDLPKKVTAFHPAMAVHGKFGQLCPDCGSKVQRIRYVSNETNYCPACQTAGKLLADRSLSRLLKSDWPKTPEELDEKLGL